MEMDSLLFSLKEEAIGRVFWRTKCTTYMFQKVLCGPMFPKTVVMGASEAQTTPEILCFLFSYSESVYMVLHIVQAAADCCLSHVLS